MRHLSDVPVAGNEVEPAVSDIHRVYVVAVHKRGDKRRSHAGEHLVFLCSFVNRFVRRIDRAPQKPFRLLRLEGSTFAELFKLRLGKGRKSACRRRACLKPPGCAAHSVADNRKETVVRRLLYYEAVLIDRAPLSDVGHTETTHEVTSVHK